MNRTLGLVFGIIAILVVGYAVVFPLKNINPQAQGTLPVIPPPIANAGLDQQVIDSDNSRDETVTLRSENIYGIRSYEWTKSDGSGFPNNRNRIALVTLPVGTHVITLTVTDQFIGSMVEARVSTDTVTITVLQSSSPPFTPPYSPPTTVPPIFFPPPPPPQPPLLPVPTLPPMSPSIPTDIDLAEPIPPLFPLPSYPYPANPFNCSAYDHYSSCIAESSSGCYWAGACSQRGVTIGNAHCSQQNFNATACSLMSTECEWKRWSCDADASASPRVKSFCGGFSGLSDTEPLQCTDAQPCQWNSYLVFFGHCSPKNASRTLYECSQLTDQNSCTDYTPCAWNPPTISASCGSNSDRYRESCQSISTPTACEQPCEFNGGGCENRRS